MVFFIVVVVSTTHPFFFVDDCDLTLPTLPTLPDIHFLLIIIRNDSIYGMKVNKNK